MFLPQLRQTKKRIKKDNIIFTGIDRNTLINDNSISVSTNLSFKHYPTISCRPARETLYTLATPKAMFAGNSLLAWVDNTSFKYNNTTEGTVTASAKSMVDFNGKIIIMPDKKYYDYGTDTFGSMEVSYTSGASEITFAANTITTTGADYSGFVVGDDLTISGCVTKTANNLPNTTKLSCIVTNVAAKVLTVTVYGVGGSGGSLDAGADTGTITIKRAIPDIDYVTTFNNRIFGVKGSNVYACKLGDYSNWNTFQYLNTDSYASDVETEGGDFTNIVRYKDHILLFKANIMYPLYGELPRNFKILPAEKVGCLGSKAAVEVDSVLYFCGSKGVYAYTGGKPQLISMPLNDIYSSAVMGTDGRLLYLSLYNGSAYRLYVYDTMYKAWLQEDTLQVLDFVTIGNYCYALSSTGALLKFNSSTESISWVLETKDFTDEVFNKKALCRIYVRMDLTTGSTATIYTSKDGAAYVTEKALSTTGLTTYTAAIDIAPKDRFKIKIAGTGDFKLYQLTREYFLSENS